MAGFTFSVPKTFEGTLRLDKYIASHPSGMNRSKLKSGVTEILVNGKKQKVSFKVKAGDLIDIKWEEQIPETIEPQDIPLDIIYEDDHICVVNKEQGMVTHPACGNWEGTLVNALLFHWKKQALTCRTEGSENEILMSRRPGIVHRLDKDTSGIIITAKDRDTQEFLCSQFASHKDIFKEYICICFGRPHRKQGIIKTKLVRDKKDRHRFKAVELDSEEDGKIAASVYNCVACYGEYSLMKVRILTGRTHQIRAHMKYLNCPIVGDSIYFKTDRKFPNATLMLHSRRLSIIVNKEGRRMNFKTALPDRFRQMMEVLHRDFKKTVLSDEKDENS